MLFDMNVYAKLYWNTYEAAKEEYSEEMVAKCKQATSDYLDACNMLYIDEEFPYNPDDKNTWKYLDSSLHSKLIPNILNPNWLYKQEQIKRGIYNDNSIQVANME